MAFCKSILVYILSSIKAEVRARAKVRVRSWKKESVGIKILLSLIGAFKISLTSLFLPMIRRL